MGWDGMYHNGRTKEQYLRDELIDLKIVASNWKGNTYFAAVRSHKDPAKIYALVVLVRKDGDYWMKKVMDESCGPYYDGASPGVMKALSPLEELYETGSNMYEWAKQWREKQVRKSVKIETGKWYQFEIPIKFSNGMEARIFKKVDGVNLWETDTSQLVRFRASQAGAYTQVS